MEEFIVNSPQFDVSKIGVGDAFCVKKNRYAVSTDERLPKGRWVNVLVTYCSPWRIGVTFVLKNDRDSEEVESVATNKYIEIEEIVSGDIAMVPLQDYSMIVTGKQ